MRVLKAIPWRTLVTSDGELQLESHGFLAAKLFAVVVLWDADGRSWVGWLTTVHHHAVCFSVSDLDDRSFRRWLAGLPRWVPGRLSLAVENPGLHLVWRCSS